MDTNGGVGQGNRASQLLPVSAQDMGWSQPEALDPNPAPQALGLVPQAQPQAPFKNSFVLPPH